jgi:UDP-N-acetylglucosamine--N-acetylmuramyl-(pentapeptide) pyrophosphoryl-undecaprenol N-acetylglucosamine transferase
MTQHLKIIISGGGTGGHIFPAIAIASEIITRKPDAEILFVGAEGRMEMEKVPQAGFNITGLPVEGLHRRLTIKNLNVIFKFLKSLKKAKKIVQSFKPDVVVGVGGYASGPLVRMASKLGIPVLIQEQNSYAGITNRLLAHKANTICVAYEGMEKYFPADKIVITGNPVREEVTKIENKRQEALKYFGIKEDKPVILVLGGSLGAKTINESILRNISLIENERINWLWQTGSLYFNDIRQKIGAKALHNLIYTDFINRMDLAYALAEVIVSRAGACTISELCLVGKPVILVPSPNVAEDHQTKNAMALVNRNAARLIRDNEAINKLVPAAIELIKTKDVCTTLSDNCRNMALKNATSKIVDEIFKLIPER